MQPKNINEYIITIIRNFPIKLCGIWLSIKNIFEIFEKGGISNVTKEDITNTIKGVNIHSCKKIDLIM